MFEAYRFLPVALAACATVARADHGDSEESRRIASMMAHPSMEGRRP